MNASSVSFQDLKCNCCSSTIFPTFEALERHRRGHRPERGPRPVAPEIPPHSVYFEDGDGSVQQDENHGGVESDADHAARIVPARIVPPVASEIQSFDWATTTKEGVARPKYDDGSIMDLQKALYRATYTEDAIRSVDKESFLDALRKKKVPHDRTLDAEYYDFVKTMGLEEKQCQLVLDFIHKCRPEEGTY